ncbi:hypothetical protein N9528_01195 [Crocinitomicaceae bacterium]|nr:hypothetical protein [Crocinitomicaceae bacterium]
MKYILFLLLITCSILSFGQTRPLKIETSKTETYQQSMNAATQAKASKTQAAAAKTQAAAARTAADAARSSAMKEPLTEILIPLEVDLNSYTHLALVSIGGTGGRTKELYDHTASTLMSSPFTIVNPTENKKLFKKNPLYLKGSKHSGWLYLYYSRSSLGVNELRDVLVRDSNNKVIYSSKNRNVSYERVLSPLINF